MRLLAICLLTLLVGCATTRTITVMSKPAGATIEVDGGVYRGKAPLTYTFTWESDTDSHRVEAILPGYQNEPRAIPRDYDRGTLLLEMHPQQKTLTILVTPADATVSINDKPLPLVANGSYVARDRPFTQDPQTGRWTEYKITAERKGFKTAVRTANYMDRDSTYTLELQPMEKEISITTSPPGAEIFFDGDSLGTNVDKVTKQFSYDVTKEKFETHKIVAKLDGYSDKPMDISWDDGKTDYHLDLAAFSKTVHIQTIPPGGQVTLEGRQLQTGSNGDTVAYLEFPPINGKPKTYSGVISKPEWKDFPITLAWDNGKTDYMFRLVPIRTKTIQLTKVAISSDGTAWKVAPSTETTLAGKDPLERSGQELQELTPPDAKGQQIDSIAISPDGKKLVYTVLVDKPGDFHSLMYMMPTDGSAAPVLLNEKDGKSLDITPSFSPDGEQILFASDRAGKLIVCAMSALKRGAIEQYSTGLTTDWWPSMDSSPKPRVFFEARSDRLQKPTLYSRPIDLNSQTYLSADGGMKPRINASNDTVVYEAYNDPTQKRDIWKMSDRGTGATNLTNSAEFDDYDASWDRLGGRIAFASDRGVDDDDKRHNYDIWVLDLTQPDAQPERVTSNVSHDDRPVWDPSGRAIYFRSNRGVQWGIWKISLK